MNNPSALEGEDLLVTNKQVLADGVVAVTITFRDESRTFPEWTPGSHIEVRLSNGLIRHYSLCGDRSDRRSLSFAVLKEPNGRGGSAFIHDKLSIGDAIFVQQLRNNFPLLPSEKYLFIAGGIGITPIIPMIAAADQEGKDWRLLYGGRSRESMAFLKALTSYGDRVVIHPQDEAGLLNLDAYLEASDDLTHIYCCGPEPLLTAVQNHASHWREGALHFERFKATEQSNCEVNKPFVIKLQRTGIEVQIKEDQTIVQALLEAGCNPSFSCMEGICGTCETPVLEGVPEHRDSVLNSEEQRAGKSMMICVSRSLSPRLVLDL